MRRSFIPIFRTGTPLFAAALIAVVNCESVDVSEVEAARVDLAPTSASVAVSQTTRFTATVLSSEGRTLPGRPVQWASDSEATALVDSTGLVRGLIPGTTTIRAASGSAIGTATVTVTPPAAIALAPSGAITFSAAQNGTPAPDRTVAVTNSGGGALTNLSAAIVYPAGAPTGWLAASLSTTSAPATLTLRATVGTLAVGSFSATVRVSSPVAQNSPQSISVSFTVTAAPPAIGLNPRNLTFNSLPSVDPPNQTVQVTNTGGMPLTGLAVSVTYPGSQPAGWISTQLAPPTTAPSMLTVRVASGTLPIATYNATLSISSPVASNSPQQVLVVYNVLGPAPTAPANLVATSVSASQIDLTWLASAGQVTRYRIERKTGTGNFALIDSVAGTVNFYQNRQLTAGTLYTYRVRACNTTTCSPYSNEASATAGLLPPGAPPSLSASAVLSTQIDLDWGAAPGSVGYYKIEQKVGAAGIYAFRDSVPANILTYQDLGLTPLTQYFYRVQACNAAGCSGFSVEANATTPNLTPNAPTESSANSAFGLHVEMIWNAATVRPPRAVQLSP